MLINEKEIRRFATKYFVSISLLILAFPGASVAQFPTLNPKLTIPVGTTVGPTVTQSAASCTGLITITTGVPTATCSGNCLYANSLAMVNRVTRTPGVAGQTSPFIKPLPFQLSVQGTWVSHGIGISAHYRYPCPSLGAHSAVAQNKAFYLTFNTVDTYVFNAPAPVGQKDKIALIEASAEECGRRCGGKQYGTHDLSSRGPQTGVLIHVRELVGMTPHTQSITVSSGMGAERLRKDYNV